MDIKTDEVLSILQTIEHKCYSNFRLEGKRLTFHYLGGKFIIIPRIQAERKYTTYFDVYHDTQLNNNSLVIVPNFYLVSDSGNVRITNYLPTDNPIERIREDEDGTTHVVDSYIPTMFVRQFEAKMEKENFAIYPTE